MRLSGGSAAAILSSAACAARASFGLDQACTMREAIVASRRLAFAYKDQGGQASERTVRPLGLYFWGERWTLAAWCEMRLGFRNFRLDRVAAVSIGSRFPDESGKRLEDFLRSVRGD